MIDVREREGSIMKKAWTLWPALSTSKLEVYRRCFAGIATIRSPPVLLISNTPFLLSWSLWYAGCYHHLSYWLTLLICHFGHYREFRLILKAPISDSPLSPSVLSGWPIWYTGTGITPRHTAVRSWMSSRSRLKVEKPRLYTKRRYPRVE